jgi:hypothetical protein
MAILAIFQEKNGYFFKLIWPPCFYSLLIKKNGLSSSLTRHSFDIAFNGYTFCYNTITINYTITSQLRLQKSKYFLNKNNILQFWAQFSTPPHSSAVIFKEVRNSK